ncbi:hypothetical protein CW304_03135 [Bacillus sp. UFRGS-B20]|nr:hypothetical protein CW304_03135 [Bacillus sp. UFRGS-B20]
MYNCFVLFTFVLRFASSTSELLKILSISGSTSLYKSIIGSNTSGFQSCHESSLTQHCFIHYRITLDILVTHCPQLTQDLILYFTPLSYNTWTV